jgi:arylsulfatase A-like enzyme
MFLRRVSILPDNTTSHPGWLYFSLTRLFVNVSIHLAIYSVPFMIWWFGNVLRPREQFQHGLLRTIADVLSIHVPAHTDVASFYDNKSDTGTYGLLVSTQEVKVKPSP